MAQKEGEILVGWGLTGAVLALVVDALRVQDLTGVPQDLWGLRLWLQLMHCIYLLTLSKYFE